MHSRAQRSAVSTSRPRSSSTPVALPPAAVVAVLPFEDLSGRVDVGETFTRVFLSALVRSGTVDVIDPGTGLLNWKYETGGFLRCVILLEPGRSEQQHPLGTGPGAPKRSRQVLPKGVHHGRGITYGGADLLRGSSHGARLHDPPPCAVAYLRAP